jgi:hypothetical protein
VNPANGIDDPVRIVESSNQRMMLSGSRIFLDFEIRVLHRAFFAARIRRTEERRESEVLPLHTPLVIQ